MKWHFRVAHCREKNDNVIHFTLACPIAVLDLIEEYGLLENIRLVVLERLAAIMEVVYGRYTIGFQTF